MTTLLDEEQGVDGADTRDAPECGGSSVTRYSTIPFKIDGSSRFGRLLSSVRYGGYTIKGESTARCSSITSIAISNFYRIRIQDAIFENAC